MCFFAPQANFIVMPPPSFSSVEKHSLITHQTLFCQKIGPRSMDQACESTNKNLKTVKILVKAYLYAKNTIEKGMEGKEQYMGTM